jgi:hypothetical protein
VHAVTRSARARLLPGSAPVSHTADEDHAIRGTSVGDTACGICRGDEVNLVSQTEEEAATRSQGSFDQSDGENGALAGYANTVTNWKS